MDIFFILRDQLNKIINRVYQPLIVKYLLVIQSGGASKNKKTEIKTPKWVKTVCGELLTDRLMQKNGFLNVIRGVLDLGGGGGPSQEVQQTQKYEIISRVLSTPPYSTYKDIEKYYQLICPQILSILYSEDKSDSEESKELLMITCACIRGLSERSLILSRRYLLDVIMKPFLDILEGSQETEMKGTSKFPKILSHIAIFYYKSEISFIIMFYFDSLIIEF